MWICTDTLNQKIQITSQNVSYVTGVQWLFQSVVSVSVFLRLFGVTCALNTQHGGFVRITSLEQLSLSLLLLLLGHHATKAQGTTATAVGAVGYFEALLHASVFLNIGFTLKNPEYSSTHIYVFIGRSIYNHDLTPHIPSHWLWHSTPTVWREKAVRVLKVLSGNYPHIECIRHARTADEVISLSKWHYWVTIRTYTYMHNYGRSQITQGL